MGSEYDYKFKYKRVSPLFLYDPLTRLECAINIQFAPHRERCPSPLQNQTGTTV